MEDDDASKSSENQRNRGENRVGFYLSNKRLVAENEELSSKLYNLEDTAFDLWVINSHDETSAKIHVCSDLKGHRENQMSSSFIFWSVTP